MGMPFFDNVNYSGKKPLDARSGYDTVANMVAATKVYDGLMAYVTATKKYYTYDSTNEADPTLGKWREFEGGGSGGASALADLTDVLIDDQTLATGDNLKYDGQRWVNGKDGIADLDDAAISNPSNGDILKYNSTTQKWENQSQGDTGAYVNGYAYTPPLQTVQQYVDAANALFGKNLTFASGVVDNKTPKSIVLAYCPTKAYIIFSLTGKITITPYNLKRSGHYYMETSRKATDGADIAGYNITPTAYGTTINSLTSITIKGAGEVDVNAYEMPDEDHEGWFYYSENATLDGTYFGQSKKLVETLYFYSDSAHTTKITPVVGKFYVDVPTGNMYKWTGTAYEMVGGSSSGYDPSDAAFTDLADGDYVPMYDTSASATKKSLWSNIKSVLKTYFDTLYQGATDKMTAADMDDVVTPLPGTKASREVYSTTEQVIGKWVDGSNLFQKTVCLKVPTTATDGIIVRAGYSASDLGIDGNFGVAFVMPSFFYNLSGGMYPLPMYTTNSGNQTKCAFVYIDSQIKLDMYNGHPAHSDCDAYVTIRYTKATT